MRLILDTHADLWIFSGDTRLSARGRQAIESVANYKLVSVVSLWEVALKVSLGKLTLHGPFDNIVDQTLQAARASLPPIQLSRLTTLTALPFHHRDPFDRLLVAQARREQHALLSADAEFDAYGVERV